MNTIRWLAPAKLNLFLHITKRRTDGYHNLQTIFQFIDYCDILHFTIRDDGQLSCESNADIAPTADLVWRAATLLQQNSRTHFGVDIRVEKKIPMGGGLGGGSSDAATTLLALNELWQLDWDKTTLAKLGLSLGADVPVFVHGHAAWAEGIGEELTPILLDEPWFLVIHPACHVSTAKIFSDQDLTRDSIPIIMRDFLAGHCTNVCEPVVRHHYPQVELALDWLNQFRPAHLTGTGACLFARFENALQANELLAKLPTQWYGFVAQGKNISPAIKASQHIK
jgi:4-diphosphocytidyl-2-C-methyl-D-erythritol kinase